MESDAAGRIEDARLSEALSERYLAYAMSTIMARSLPDVRDGLKPVHRRLLYAMHQLKLDPTSGFKKCARVVGDVIGKFHPHGDASVYEALVRLAQDFAVRYPLVEGQGNFGSIDGDNAAAMRYTESRLTVFAAALLDGISEDTVDFRPTYDNEESEPVVMPGAFPNLLANGAAGIAVGMATSIPPHNAAELCQAAAHLIKTPHASTRDLMAFVPGPDFPTGGRLVENSETILQAYETGRGSLRTRAKWSQEHGRFGSWTIIVTEIPYQVQKSRLIEQIAELLEQRKLPLLADIRDESTTDIRLVLEPKSKTANPEVLMETLFRQSALESRFSLNMNVLDAERVPRVMGLKEILRHWLDHRHEVLKRRSQFRLNAVEKRLEILEGFLAVYLNLDEVIRIIREEDDPKQSLKDAFGLTELQTEYVLNMRLRSLRKLEEMEIRKERDGLAMEQTSLKALLDSEKRRWTRISKELEETTKVFAKGPYSPRRTMIDAPPASIDLSSAEEVEKEPLTIILSREGWIRAVRGHGIEVDSHKFKEGDGFRQQLACQSTQRICVLTSDGRAFTIKAAELPRGRGYGQPIRLLADIPQDAGVVSLFVIEEDGRQLIATRSGRGLVITHQDLVAEKRTGKQVVNLRDGDAVLAGIRAAGTHVLTLGENRRALIFPLEQVPALSRGQGVTLQKFAHGGLADIRVMDLAEGLIWAEGQKRRVAADLDGLVGRRALQGRPAPVWMKPV